MKIQSLLLAAAVIFFCSTTALAQQPCRPPDIVFNKTTTNIFNEEQEMYLGEVMAETLDKNFSVLADDKASAYLRGIGERLIKHLPPTNIKFQFFVVDSPELNAFNVAGGRVYVTRKLISFVRNEDELAGILGHELGHGIVRHHSADVSKLFKEILGIDRVGDRQDVFDKFNQYLDRQRTKRVKQGRGHEGEQQLEADRVGLFAMIAAGYDPNAYATAWERMTEAKRRGGGLGDLFAGSKPEEKRLREMLKAIGSLPMECRDTKAASTTDTFKAWQSYVVSIAKVRNKEKLRGLAMKGILQPHLRGAIRHFQFSPDGEHVIAQDATGINVLQREPFAFLFRINIDDAKNAHFTPDSKQLVLQTYGLRVEVWDVATRKPSVTREVYVRDNCVQTALSPDGKTLVCYSLRGNLDLINVETNEKILSKEKFYEPNIFEFIDWRFDIFENQAKEVSTLEMEFSPDGKYFLGGKVYRIALTGGVDTSIFRSFFIDMNQDAFIAYDLHEKKEVKLPGSLRSIVASPFAFYSNDTIIGQHREDAEKSGLFKFPTGERIEKFYLSANSYEKPHKGDYILVRPTRTNPVGVYSVPLKKFVLANKSAAMDGFGDFFISEGTDGVVDLVKVTGEKIENLGSAYLPKNDIGDLRTIAVSDNVDTLALSESARGGVWDLKTGARKIYIRGFRGAYVDPKGSVFADFPAYEQEVRVMARLDSATGGGEMLEPITARGTRQIGNLLVRLRTKFDEAMDQQLNDSKAGKPPSPESDEEKKKRPDVQLIFGPLRGMTGSEKPEATLEVTDAVTRKVLWSRRFENGAPQYDFSVRSQTVALYWPVMSKGAKEVIKTSPELGTKLKSMGEKQGDYLVQVLNATTGAPIRDLLIETGEGSFSINRVTVSGDWFSIIDSENRVLFYDLKTGEMKSRVFGEKVVMNPALGIAIVENVPGVLAIVDMNTGTRLDDLRFPHEVIYTTFNSEGTKLFVLTANQQYYIFNAEGLRPTN